MGDRACVSSYIKVDVVAAVKLSCIRQGAQKVPPLFGFSVGREDGGITDYTAYSSTTVLRNYEVLQSKLM